MFQSARRLASIPFTIYNNVLERQPLLTTCLTSGVMYAGGDAVSQCVENHQNNKTRVENNEQPLKLSLDKSRLAISFLFGTLISGPAYHYWFTYLNELPTLLWRLKQTRQRGKILRSYAYLKTHGIEVKLDLSKLPKSKPLSKWASKAAKIAADQLIFSVLYMLVYFMGIGCMKGALQLIDNNQNQAKMDEANEFIENKYHLPDALFKELLDRLSDHIEENEEDILKDENGDKQLEQYQIISAIFDKLKQKQKEENMKNYNKIGYDNDENLSSIKTWNDVWNTSWQHTKKVYVNTYLADCLIWPPLQLINFTFVPVRYQFLFVNVCNLAWNTFLSFMANKKH
eukprot:gene13843-18566_t